MVVFVLAVPCVVLSLLLLLGRVPHFEPGGSRLGVEEGLRGSLVAFGLVLVMVVGFSLSLAALLRVRWQEMRLPERPVKLALIVVLLVVIIGIILAWVVVWHPCWIGVPNCN